MIKISWSLLSLIYCNTFWEVFTRLNPHWRTETQLLHNCLRLRMVQAEDCFLKAFLAFIYCVYTLVKVHQPVYLITNSSDSLDKLLVYPWVLVPFLIWSLLMLAVGFYSPDLSVFLCYTSHRLLNEGWSQIALAFEGLIARFGDLKALGWFIIQLLGFSSLQYYTHLCSFFLWP